MKTNRRRIVIGVGGNIGAGKTTFSRQLVKRGAKYLSADRLGWQVLSEIAPALKRKFGKNLIKGNRVDRKRLGRLVFKDPKSLSYLNRISHPLIKTKIKEIIRNEKSVLVLDAALLFQWDDIMSLIDYPVLVTASSEKKIQRARRKGINRTFCNYILRSQIEDAKSAKMASYIAINCSTKKTLDIQCDKIYKEIINDRNMQ